MKVNRSAALLVTSAICLSGCASASHPKAADTRASATTANRTVETHPLTCFPGSVTASLDGIPAAEHLATPPVATAAQPVTATLQLGQEPASVTLTGVSLQVLPAQPGPGLGTSTIVSATPPSRVPAVKSIAVPSPRAGVAYHFEIDGTSDTPGVTPTPGLYDVEVVQDVTVTASCVNSDPSEPSSDLEVHTTIGQIRLP